VQTRVWPPALPSSGPRASIGVFGGSGFYSFLPEVTEVVVDTPYGPPSGPIALGTVEGVAVAFLARHGHGHSTPAHAVNFRANLWAMQQLGVQAVIAPCAVGSLQPDLHPGLIVVPDQLVDRTHGRADTYFDGSDGVVNHVTFADPYTQTLRALTIAACEAEDIAVRDGGVCVVINGPRFSTRAESRWFRSMGWSVVNMTQYPEAVLAAELQLPYVGIALVTDFDSGVDGNDGIEPVTMAQVMGVLEANVGNVRRVLFRLIPEVARNLA
jgi:5'-methylthioadenosine phosphorylase